MDTSTYEERLNTLRQELRYYENLLYSQITAINSDIETQISSKIDLKSDPRNAIPLLQQDVLLMLQEAQQTSEYLERNREELLECESLIAIMNIVIQVTDVMKQCDDGINDGDVLKASRLIIELKKNLDLLPKENTEIGAGVVCSLLRRESQLIIYRHKSKLFRFLRHFLSVETGKIYVTKVVKGILEEEDFVMTEPLELKTLWDAVIMMSYTNEVVDSIVTDCWRLIIKPLWSERKRGAPRISRSDDVSELLLEGNGRDGQSIGAGTFAGSSSATLIAGGAKAQSLGSNMDDQHTGYACKMPFPSLLELISSILNFVWSEVFCSREELTGRMSHALQSTTIDLYTVLAETLRALIPKTEAELAQFQRNVEKSCREFDARLSIWGIVPNPTTASKPTSSTGALSAQGSNGKSLSDMIAAGQAHFATVRRRELLSRARELIVSDYHNTMLATGDASEDDPASAGNVGDPKALLEQSGSFALQTLRFESCQVSLASCRILKHIRDILSQACNSSPELSTMFYETARDCFELFMAVVPLRFAELVKTSPRMGAVFYNDCCYIAHNTTLISHAYRHTLAQRNDKLVGSIGFVDFIPRYRALGEAVLADHVEEQRLRLMDLVAKINIRTELEALPASDSAPKSSVRRAARSMLVGGLQKGFEALTAAAAGYGAVDLAPISGVTGSSQSTSLSAPPTTGTIESAPNDVECAKLVVQHIERLGQQWQRVLQDAVYTRLIAYLIECVLRQSMTTVLSAECITERAGTDVSTVYRLLQKMRSCLPTDSENDSIAVNCSSWKKFCALTDLLEYSLSDVAEWLPRRKFSTFTGAEMTSLIQALFEDTPKRQGILQSIQEMSA